MVRCLGRSFSLAVTFGLSFSVAGHEDGERQERLAIRTVSTDPDRISDGHVLVEISFPRGTSSRSLIVSLNGRDVSGAFRSGRAPNTVLELVTGLALVRNRLRVEPRRKAIESRGCTN